MPPALQGSGPAPGIDGLELPCCNAASVRLRRSPVPPGRDAVDARADSPLRRVPSAAPSSVKVRCDDPAPIRRRRPRRHSGCESWAPPIRRHRGPYSFGSVTPSVMVWVIAGEAAIAPQPFAAREIGSQRRALGIRAVATFAGRARHLAVEDTARRARPVRALLRAESAGRRPPARPRPDGCLPAAPRPRPPKCRRVGRRGGGRDGRSRRSAIGDSPNPPARVVRDVERAVGPDREPGRPVRGLARFLDRAGETVGEDHIIARTACRRRAAGTPRCSRPAGMAPGSMTRGRR